MEQSSPSRVRVLFLFANTIHENELNQTVLEVLYNHMDQFDVFQYGGVTVSTAMKMILHHKPNIVHISGHCMNGEVTKKKLTSVVISEI